MRQIVPQMAPLAQCRKVVKPVVGFVVVQVCNRKHHLAPRYRVWLVVFGTTELTFVLRSPEPDQLTNQFPLRVILFVVDWHS
jgi:hypothetical protein